MSLVTVTSKSPFKIISTLNHSARGDPLLAWCNCLDRKWNSSGNNVWTVLGYSNFLVIICVRPDRPRLCLHVRDYERFDFLKIICGRPIKIYADEAISMYVHPLDLLIKKFVEYISTLA